MTDKPRVIVDANAWQEGLMTIEGYASIARTLLWWKGRPRALRCPAASSWR